MPSFFGSSPSSVARVRRVLDLAREDPEIGGVLVRIDGPGGTATASEQVYTESSVSRRKRASPSSPSS